MADIDNLPPLVVCMESYSGEEVSLSIHHGDTFLSFLEKARNLLGYEVDMSSLTSNQDVSPTDNIYQFLLNAEMAYNNAANGIELPKNMDVTEENNNNLVYVLDDGTQINASQIHFDNDDLVDLTKEKLPFIKYIDDDLDEYNDENIPEEKTIIHNIIDSPVRKNTGTSPKKSFINSLPFKAVSSNADFEAQIAVYLDANLKTYTTLNTVSNRNKSPRSLIKDNYKSYINEEYKNDDFNAFSREEILNMFKDSPVTSLPYEPPQSQPDKRRHIRKTDPTRPVYKKPENKYEADLSIFNRDCYDQNCFICDTIVDRTMEKLYLFDNEDQKIHKDAKIRRPTELKIICERCLSVNFKHCTSKNPNQPLNPDEYLVIRNNQQYIFQKIVNFETIPKPQIQIKPQIAVQTLNKDNKLEFVQLEFDENGEIITRPVKDAESSSSDVEIIEPPDLDIKMDTLEEVDEQVKEFLGEQHGSVSADELVCRFCTHRFVNVSEVLDHCDVHKHDMDDGQVFPCPLCDYGYAESIWLKGHVKAAHGKTKPTAEIGNITENVTCKDLSKAKSKSNSPATENTNQSYIKSPQNQQEKGFINNEISKNKTESTIKEEIAKNISQTSSHIIKTEVVKQELLDSSDEEAIWIVQSGSDGASLDEELLKLLAAKKEENSISKYKKPHQCLVCRQRFLLPEMLGAHKCMKRRPRKQKTTIKDTTTRWFRAHTKKPRKKRNSNDIVNDPQIVTCNNCNQSFTSKVRLKFHMQFHESPTSLRSDGKYRCVECVDCTEFNTESELFDHVHFQHDKQKRWQCPVKDCGKTFYLRATLTKHSRTHTDTRRYVCPTCGKRFLDKQTLDEHGVTHLQIKPFQCHICLKQLTRRSRLRMHLRAHEEELSPTLVRVCAACHRAFSTHANATEHGRNSVICLETIANELKQEDDVQLSPTSGLVTKSHEGRKTKLLSTGLIPLEVTEPRSNALLAGLPDELRPLIRVVEIEKAFRCEYCEDVFYTENGLNEHRAIHKGVKNPFTCHICKVTFATYSRCTTHKTTHGFYKRPLSPAVPLPPPQGHKGGDLSSTNILGYGGFPVVKHFLCEDCGRSYLHWTYLQVHRRMKHANDNFLYKCNQCELTFPNTWSVAYHRKKIHGKTAHDEGGGSTKVVKEYYRIPCRDCDEVLPTKNALYKHRKKEHSDLALKINNNGKDAMYACRTCNKRYASKNGLDAHEKTHDVPQQRLHSIDRPYPCDLCPLSFRKCSAMRSHRAVHGGGGAGGCPRSWACPRCPRRFRTRTDLTSHLRNRHPQRIYVLEVAGLNPTSDDVMQMMTTHNIPAEKVIDVSKITFHKGTSSIIPCSERALSLLSGLQKTDNSLWNNPISRLTNPAVPITDYVGTPRHHFPESEEFEDYMVMNNMDQTSHLPSLSD